MATGIVQTMSGLLRLTPQRQLIVYGVESVIVQKVTLRLKASRGVLLIQKLEVLSVGFCSITTQTP